MRFPANIFHICCVELALKGLASAGKGLLHTGFPQSLTNGYAMMMSPRKGKTAVHGFHCPCDMAVQCMSVREWQGRGLVYVCPLL